MLYGWVADQLEADAAQEASTCVIRFEDLCDDPAATMRRLFEHCELDGDTVVEQFAETIHAPTYYRPSFPNDEIDVIFEETSDVARRFGYSDAAQVPQADEAMCIA